MITKMILWKWHYGNNNIMGAVLMRIEFDMMGMELVVTNCLMETLLVKSGLWNSTFRFLIVKYDL
jgi:hypothetical protein